MELYGKRALVMGLGVHGGGLGVARFLASHGAQVTVTDLHGPELLQPSLDALSGLPIRFVLGEHHDDDFRNADIVVQNPGVPSTSRFLEIARASGAAIETEMTLFFRLCPGPILGITGTKGKTTTTTLAGAMLREQFADTVVAGNLRVSALAQLAKIGPNTPVVLELSSFALEALGAAKLSPRFACVTNLAPDHLDRYSSMEAYAEAKRQVFLWQGAEGVTVLNQADATVSAWAADAPGRLVWFGPDGGPPADAPTVLYGQDGLWWDDPAARGDAAFPERICWRDEIALPGTHNLANVAAAAALAKAFGVGTAQIRDAIRAFHGVEHRLELVRELGGVRYVNDTAATVPEAAVAALHSFDGPIVLIAGGADKRLPLDAFADAIAERAGAVVLLHGTATPALQKALASRRLPPQFEHGPYSDFEEAIRAARELAVPGATVLLSPGCASFGMFRNEFHRGEEFRRIVGEFT